MSSNEEFPLIRRYPALRGIERLPLGDFPSPVQETASLGERFGIGRLFVKRDDVCATPYGGNKVRKLEFLLPLARSSGAGTILTIGAAGSNHVLATTIYAKQIGIGTTAAVFPQAPSQHLRKNLAADVGQGTRFSYSPHMYGTPLAAQVAWLRIRAANKRAPFWIPAGGTTVRSCLGYVNAALELAAQVDAGLTPEPDLCFVTVGTGGIAAGLLVGFALAGLRTKIVGVRVVDRLISNETTVRRLAAGTAEFIARRAGITTPAIADFAMEHRCFGGEYARYTTEGVKAMNDAQQCAGLSLDGTYTGKTLAALRLHARGGGLARRTVLFWNTYNSLDTSPLATDTHWIDRLPAPLARLASLPDHAPR